VDATTSSVGTAVVIVLPPVTVVMMVVYRWVDDETRGVVIVVSLLTVERLIVVAADPEPMTTISEEVTLDDLADDVFVLWPEDAPEEAAEEPDEAAAAAAEDGDESAEEDAAVVWLAEEESATEEEGPAELVVSAAGEVADVDGASDEVVGAVVGVVSGVEVGVSLVVGAADVVGTDVVEGGWLLVVGGVDEVVSGTVEEVVGAADEVDRSTTTEEVCAVDEVLAPVPTREFWRLSIHGRLFAFPVEKTMVRAKSRAIRLSERGIVCDMQKSRWLQVIGAADRTEEKCLSEWLPGGTMQCRGSQGPLGVWQRSCARRIIYTWPAIRGISRCTSCDAKCVGAMKTSERRAREEQWWKSKAYVRGERKVHVQVGLQSDDEFT
jgi:hypothetical protein